jgi:ubiquitin
MTTTTVTMQLLDCNLSMATARQLFDCNRHRGRGNSLTATEENEDCNRHRGRGNSSTATEETTTKTTRQLFDCNRHRGRGRRRRRGNSWTAIGIEEEAIPGRQRSTHEDTTISLLGGHANQHVWEDDCSVEGATDSRSCMEQWGFSGAAITSCSRMARRDCEPHPRFAHS